MPVVAIAGAIVAGVAAAGAVSAVAAGGLAALTLTGALEITAAVGATLGAVGAVTRDKGLMTAGLVIGGIGGIGALAANAGILGADASTASLFGDSSTAATDAGLPAGAMSPEGFPDLSGAASTDAAQQNSIVDTLGNTDATKALPTSSTAQQTTATGMINRDVAAGTGIAETPSTAASNTATSTVTTMPKEVPTSTLSPWVTPPAAAPAAPTTFSTDLAKSVVAPSAPSVAPPGVFGSLADFASKNQMVSYGLIQAGGSLVNGLFNPVTPAQVAALDAQAAQNRAAASLGQTQATNITQPIPVAKRITPVTGQPAGAGIINSQPYAVTGAPM